MQQNKVRIGDIVMIGAGGFWRVVGIEERPDGSDNPSSDRAKKDGNLIEVEYVITTDGRTVEANHQVRRKFDEIWCYVMTKGLIDEFIESYQAKWRLVESLLPKETA